MKSMTGFGQAAGENEAFRFAASVRSVNHRFLDLALRLADDVRAIEPALRELVDDRLTRGRVDLRISIEPLAAGESQVELDREVIAGVLAALGDVEGAGLGEEPLTRGDLLRLPEAVRVRRRGLELGADDRALLLEVAATALDSLVEMRQGEGEQLSRVLGDRLQTLRTVVERLAHERDEARGRLLDNMRQRLDELLEGREIDADRLAQEAVLLAEKTDVQEELDRLAAHLQAFEGHLKSEEAVGRRLDFLAQELHRELNTLGAKCRDAKMAQWVVDGKVACEQIREQVQNVE